MSNVERVLAVTVPASTSNLGPGFDCMGLALSLALEVEARVTPGASGVRFTTLEGTASDWPRGSENLLARAFELGRARFGAGAWSLAVAARSEIPVARGLGSSGAAVAAGLLLASALAPRAATRDELLRLGLELEGHPDNASAALVGGCTLAVPTGDGGLALVEQALSPELGFALAWPETRLSTGVARKALPREVAFADAVENPRRLALLLEGLRRADPVLLALGGEDRLHVRHRLPLIAGASEALRAARAAGAWLATISGSGSALFAVCARDRRAAIAEAMRAELARAGGNATARVVEPVFGAPRVRAL